MSKYRSPRYRSVVITIQQYAIFKAIVWHQVPKLLRVTMQFEDKDPQGLPTEKKHIQAFLEFSDQVAQSTLKKYIHNVHFPSEQELANLKVRFPKGLTPQQGRFYCSNPVKRISGTIPCIWENGRWIEGADFLAALEQSSIQVDKIFELPCHVMRDSYFIHHAGEQWEVFEEGTEVLRPKPLRQCEASSRFACLGAKMASINSRQKLRENNYKP